jgi:hypothetical protein
MILIAELNLGSGSRHKVQLSWVAYTRRESVSPGPIQAGAPRPDGVRGSLDSDRVERAGTKLADTLASSKFNPCQSDRRLDEKFVERTMSTYVCLH